MMKTKILSFLFLMGIVLIGTNVYAQPATGSAAGARVTTATADVGSTMTYSFSAPTTGFTWSITKVSGTGTAPSDPSDTDNSVTVTWSGVDDGDVYDVEAYITDANGCYSEMYAFRVTVSEDGIDFDGADDSQDATVCSDLNGSVEGGDYTGEEDTNSDYIIYTATYTGNDNLDEIVFQITDGTNYYDESLVDKGTTAYNIEEDLATRSGSPTAVDNDNITISGKTVTFNVDANLYNSTGSDITLSVNIISGTTVNGASLSPGSTHTTADMVVQAIPSITF